MDVWQAQSPVEKASDAAELMNALGGGARHPSTF